MPDTETSGEDTVYVYQQIAVETASRGRIISSIINDRYSNDCQIAILSNKDDGNPEHAAEYDAFQKFREFAKKIADKIYGI